MATFEDILKLCEEEQGKIFVVDKQGNVQFVVMGKSEYAQLKVRKVEGVKHDIADPEIVNQEILKAQLHDRGAPSAAEGAPLLAARPTLPPVDAWRHLPGNNPYPPAHAPQVKSDIPKRDLREEVIDPSFDFDGPEDL